MIAIKKFEIILPLSFMILLVLSVVLAMTPFEKSTTTCGSGFISYCFGWFSSILILLYLPFGSLIALFIHGFGIDIQKSEMLSLIPAIAIYLGLLYFIGKRIDLLLSKKRKSLK